MKDKKTGGYLLGQNVVMLYLVTEKFSIPVGFAFYAPDPVLKKWKETTKSLKQEGVDKSLWPKKPDRSVEYLKKYEIAIALLRDFKISFPEVHIQAILADNLYGHLPFMQAIEVLWPKMQFIVKMRKNQTIHILTLS